MRLLVLSIVACASILGVAWAQNTDSTGAGAVPVGQTFKNFIFPLWQDNQLKFTLTATQATGITQNRAEAMDVKIQIFDNGVATTTITSPQADLYVSDQKMRSSHTVQIERSDMEATSQNCDFDLKTKKYLLRTNVKVTLKNFDPGTSLNGGTTNASNPATTNAPAASAPTPPATPASSPMTPRSLLNSDSLPQSPGAASAPIPPTSTDNK
jgi:hypothetical protein